MNTKSLIVLAVVAAVLGGAAYYLNGNAKGATPKLNGKAVFPELDASAVAKISIGEKLRLAAGEKGWTIESLYGYPADRDKIVENLLKLKELKVGQVVRGKKLASTERLTLADAAGKELAGLALGERHAKWGHGRYASFAGETVLVSDELDAFDGDAKRWCNARIASVPSSSVTAVAFARGTEKVELEKGTNSTWTLKGLAANEEIDTSKTYSLDSALSYLDFASVADPKLDEAVLGFTTGTVYTVTYKEGSNTVTRVATVGNAVKDGTDRYFKLDNAPWIYTISSYSAEALTKTRKDLVKAKPEPKKLEPEKKSAPAPAKK